MNHLQCLTMRRKLLVILIYMSFFSLAIWSAERFCHSQTGGFTLLNITDPRPNNPRWEVRKPEVKELLRIKKILNQEFTLMFPGGQNYAFLSQDDQYVLKITKHKRMRVPLWAQKLPLPPALEKRREKTKQKKQQLFESTFDSYIIANQYLHEFCGIEYLHLNKTDYLKQKLILVDWLGVKHKIDLDQYEFILQKRCILTHAYIDQLILDHKEQQAKEAILKLVRYVAYRISLGIEDHDICYGTNFGFYQGEPFQLDIGSLRFNPSYLTFDVFKTKIKQSTNNLRQWLSSKHPALVSYLDELTESIIEERKSGPISYKPH